MHDTIKIGPVTRIEGHLDLQVTVDTVNGQNVVTDAQSSGTMFRGFEIILKGRDPRDASHYTQRICGVCPISHGMAAALNLEAAFGVQPPANGRILRNLILAANYIQSHVLHFYHLAALDYIDASTVPAVNMPPWTPRYSSPDLVTGAAAARLVDHYVQALAIRRKAHQMGAIFGGRMPSSPTLVPGGCTETVTAAAVTNYRNLLTELRTFIDTIYVPDVLQVAGLFPDYYSIGAGCGNLLAYGVFDLNTAGTQKLLARGRYTGGQLAAVDTAQIKEYVKYSWYSSGTGLNPSAGLTTPSATKAGAYSWLKSPRYQDKVHEVGPLARMYVNGDYRHGISVLDRIAARALEAQKVANAANTWLDQLVPGQPVYTYGAIPATAKSQGLTEAPRGALGHWMDISASKIARYQIVTPTNWNASPKDDLGQMGPIEQALMGTPVADINNPIELLRVVHSFDPCLSCSVHVARPGGDVKRFVVAI